MMKIILLQNMHDIPRDNKYNIDYVILNTDSGKIEETSQISVSKEDDVLFNFYFMFLYKINTYRPSQLFIKPGLFKKYLNYSEKEVLSYIQKDEIFINDKGSICYNDVAMKKFFEI